MNSLIIPIYRNQASISDLLAALKELSSRLRHTLEVVFVVDGSPDDCFELLRNALPNMPFHSRLLLHSRNFGSFAAIRSGLTAAQGPNFAVMAADLQEPIDLAFEFFQRLDLGEVDVIVGSRDSRQDPLLARLASRLFWWAYRKLVMPHIPKGGVDVFGCNLRFRNQLLALDESHSSLIGLIFWLGFRREEVRYHRLGRQYGKSAWTLGRKFNYLMDSIFAFSDLPVKLLLGAGIAGLGVSILFGIAVLLLRLTGQLLVPGYSATIITLLFFGGLNALGLGIIGAYVWRAYANTQRRPLAVIMQEEQYVATAANIVPPRGE